MAKPGIAVQLFSLRDDMAKDFVGTLRAVTEIGYTAVELVSYYGAYGLSASQLKATFADLGLTPIGIHVAPAALQDRFEETLDFYLAAGVPEMIVPGLPREFYADADGFRRGGNLLARLAERCQDRGVGLSYHNHHHDFDRFGEQFGLDYLLAASPAVGLEADVYWISYAGYDPATIIRRYANRCRFVHLKDKPAVIDVTIEDVMNGKADGSRLFAEVGEGVVDWPAVFAAVEATPAKWYVVEQDASTRPMLESIAISLRHLKEWGKA